MAATKFIACGLFFGLFSNNFLAAAETKKEESKKVEDVGKPDPKLKQKPANSGWSYPALEYQKYLEQNPSDLDGNPDKMNVIATPHKNYPQLKEYSPAENRVVKIKPEEDIEDPKEEDKNYNNYNRVESNISRSWQ
jgi:hypothetical protein